MANRIGRFYSDINHHAVYQWWLLGGVTVLAAALRLYRLGEWSFWIEEHHTLRHSNALESFDIAQLVQLRVYFFFIIKSVLQTLGESEWSARLVPMLVGVISIPLLYWIVSKLINFPVAILSATLLAIAPWHVYWSQNARFYTLLLIFYSASLFAFYWGVEEDRFRYYVLAVVFLGLAGLLHPYAAILIPIFVVYLIFLKILPFEKPAGLRLKYFVIITLLLLLGYAVFEAYLILAGSRPLYLTLYVQFFDESTATFIGLANPFVMLTATVYYIGVPLAFMTLPGSIFLLLRKSRAGLLIMLGAYLPLATMMMLTLFASTSNRYVFMSLACWVILAAVGVKELYERTKKNKAHLLWMLGMLIFLIPDPAVEDLVYFVRRQSYLGIWPIAAGVIGIIAYLRFMRVRGSTGGAAAGMLFLLMLLIHPLVIDTMYFAYQDGHRENWKAVSAFINREKRESDIVFSGFPNVARYYLTPGTDLRSEGTFDFDSVLGEQRRIWFVQSNFPDKAKEAAFGQWAAQNCKMVASWTQYIGGRSWPMVVHQCDP